MTSFSLYQSPSQDVDLLVRNLAGRLDTQAEIAKTASIKEEAPRQDVIASLMDSLVKHANGLDPVEHASLLEKIDDTLSFIDNEIITKK